MLTRRQRHCLNAIGITPWQTRPAADLAPGVSLVAESIVDDIAPPSISSVPDKVAHQPAARETFSATVAQDFELSDWPSLLQSIEACQNCTLAQSCTRKVAGKGFQQADLLIVGEAPGHDEDLQGLPFVGRAGQLLDKMLQAIDLDPKQVYITNILKCRPPNNRDPLAQEVQSCSQFLQAQMALIKPRVILSVGRISAQNLLQDSSPVGKLRGITHTLPGTDIPLIVTYHPAYLLRSPAEKGKVWQDLKTLKRLLEHATG